MNVKQLHAFYMSLGRKLIAVLRKDFVGVNQDVDLVPGEYDRVNLPRGFDARFTRWSGDTKPYYIVLYDELDDYKLELDLTAVLIVDGRYSWFIGRRSNVVNREFFKSDYEFSDKLPSTYVDAVREAKGVLHAGINVQKSGYTICQNVDEDEFFDIFSRLMADALSAHWRHANMGKNRFEIYGIEDVEALEGYGRDRAITSYVRNQGLIKARKKKDNYTCQVCGFRLSINGAAIIECHHVDPLSGGIRVTKIDDLICLCPTCHRIAHQRELPYTVHEIQELRGIAA